MNVLSKVTTFSRISTEMTVRGTIFGVIFGATYGTCLAPLFGTFMGAIYGGVVGFGLGIVTGVLNALIALAFACKMRRENYLWVTGVCTALVSVSGGMIGFGELETNPYGDLRSVVLMIILPAFIAGAVAAWQSRKVVVWAYPDDEPEKQKNKAKRQPLYQPDQAEMVPIK